MMTKRMKAAISGVTNSGRAFTVNVMFELFPPTEKSYYGTGCYMGVEMYDAEMQFVNDFSVDVRHEGTTDIDKLADAWIKGYFGENAQKVVKSY